MVNTVKDILVGIIQNALRTAVNDHSKLLQFLPKISPDHSLSSFAHAQLERKT